MRNKIIYLFLFIIFPWLPACNGDGTIRGNVIQQVVVGPTLKTEWDFSQASDYNFDNSLIDFSGGQARLKTVNTLFDSALKFDAGTHFGTKYSGGYLQLDPVTSLETNVLQILPARASNLKTYFRMDNNWNDEMGNIAAGVPTWITFILPKVGTYASLFQTAAAKVSFTTLASPQISGAIWIRREDAVSVTPYILDTPGYSLTLKVAGGPTTKNRIEFSAKKTGTMGSWDTDDETIFTYGWMHVGFSYDSSSNSNVPSLYINGKKMNVTTLTAPVGTQVANAGSGMLANNVGGTEAFNGILDELVLFDAKLTDDEFFKIYQRQSGMYSGIYSSPVIDVGRDEAWTDLSVRTPFPFGKELTAAADQETITNYDQLGSTLSQGLVALWHFDESTLNSAPGGKAVADLSGYGHHLADNVAGITAVEPDSDGVLGRSGRFAAGGILKVNDSAELSPTSTMSVQAWIKTTRATGYFATVLGKSSGPNNLSYVLNFDVAGTTIRFITGNDGPSSIDYASMAFPQDSEWHQVVGVATASYVIIYLDGQEKNRVGRVFPFVDTADAICVGGFTQTGVCAQNPFKGGLDEVAIWNRDLSDAEVRELYRRGRNKVSYQVRSCAGNPCDETTEPWLGISGGDGSVFSEMQNNSILDGAGVPTGQVNKLAPNFNFSLFPAVARPSNKRFFQYRVSMAAGANLGCLDGSSNPTACLPSVKQVQAGPTGKIFAGSPSISSVDSAPYSKLVEATALTNAACASYQISSNGTDWKYWSGSAWSPASSWLQSNAVGDLTAANLGKLSGSQFYWKAFLSTDAGRTQNCELDHFSISGKK